MICSDRRVFLLRCSSGTSSLYPSHSRQRAQFSAGPGNAINSAILSHFASAQNDALGLRRLLARLIRSHSTGPPEHRELGDGLHVAASRQQEPILRSDPKLSSNISPGKSATGSRPCNFVLRLFSHRGDRTTGASRTYTTQVYDSRAKNSSIPQQLTRLARPTRQARMLS